MNFKTAVSRGIFLVLLLEHRHCGCQRSVNCRTVFQTDALPFRIGKQGEEFAPGGYTCVSTLDSPDLESFQYVPGVILVLFSFFFFFSADYVFCLALFLHILS